MSEQRRVYIVEGAYGSPRLSSYVVSRETDKMLYVLDNGYERHFRKNGDQFWSFDQEEARQRADEQIEKEIERLEKEIERLRGKKLTCYDMPHERPSRNIVLD